MQARRTVLGAWFLVTLFVLQSTFSTVDLNDTAANEPLQNSDGVEWVQFDLVDGVYGEAIGSFDEVSITETRTLTADSSIGTFDADGLHLDRALSSAWLEGRATYVCFWLTPQLNCKRCVTTLLPWKASAYVNTFHLQA